MLTAILGTLTGLTLVCLMLVIRWMIGQMNSSSARASDTTTTSQANQIALFSQLLTTQQESNERMLEMTAKMLANQESSVKEIFHAQHQLTQSYLTGGFQPQETPVSTSSTPPALYDLPIDQQLEHLPPQMAYEIMREREENLARQAPEYSTENLDPRVMAIDPSRLPGEPGREINY